MLKWGVLGLQIKQCSIGIGTNRSDPSGCLVCSYSLSHLVLHTYTRRWIDIFELISRNIFYNVQTYIVLLCMYEYMYQPISNINLMVIYYIKRGELSKSSIHMAGTFPRFLVVYL